MRTERRRRRRHRRIVETRARIVGILLGALLLASFGLPDDAAPKVSSALVPLCAESADPDLAPDKVHIRCNVERWSYASPSEPPPSELLVMAWNLERGRALDAQLDAFRDGLLPRPDVLLISEADRGCSRTGERNVTEELARNLGMNAAFGVEFVELPRAFGAGGRIDRACEHGNAVLSRFPLENPRVVRFASGRSWYEPRARRSDGEPRLGGRMALSVDVTVGRSTLRTYSLHLESGPTDTDWRTAQLRELADDARTHDGPVLLGGDANVHGYAFDLLFGTSWERGPDALFAQGFVDAHASLAVRERGSHMGVLVIDLVLGRGVTFQSPDRCAAPPCALLSDHSPVWARAKL